MCDMSSPSFPPLKPKKIDPWRAKRANQPVSTKTFIIKKTENTYRKIPLIMT